jgi:hypothetical protein
MKLRKYGTLAILACGFAVFGAAQTQDMKDAGNSTKKAAKKTGHKVKKGTKHAAHKAKTSTQ